MLRTRADIQELVGELLRPLAAHFSPGRAAVTLGSYLPWYGEPAASLEGFARPLWGIVPLLMGGGSCEHLSLWQEGLLHGTDPDHPEFWGWAGDCDQRSVEMPVIALAAAWRPQEFWEPLGSAGQANLVRWLGRINEVEVVDNNWRFFRVLVNAALRRLGAEWSHEMIDADLKRLDSFYLGNGWYADGEGRRGDYYVPMAFHLYGLLFARLAAGPAELAWAERLRERARRFAPDFVRWFAADGAAVPFGRSLTYRFAAGAFWGALPLADLEAVPWGVARGLWARHLRWWMAQPMRTESGVLTIGYCYPNTLLAENYNGPGSPYWAFKAFLPLALPAEHPFWQAEETPLPAPQGAFTAPEAGLVITSDPAGGQVVALNAGQPVTDFPRHAAHKYSKFAYSSRHAFSVAAGTRLAEGGFDSVLAVSDDGERYRARERCEDAKAEGGIAASRWRPWPDVEIETRLIAEPDGAHVREHRIRTARPLWTADNGFAVGFGRPAEIREESVTPNAITVRTLRGHSGLADLSGGRALQTVPLEPGTNLASPLAVMPSLQGRLPPGEHLLRARVWAG